MVELARGLKNDPFLIYEHVLNNIDYLPIWGVLKGSTGALIDGQGSAIDIAQLTVELLAAANPSYAPTLVRGTIQITTAQARAWLGLDTTSTCALADRFVGGGIPTSTDATGGAGGTVCTGGSTIQISHVWVRFTAGGTTYQIDPSFKTHTIKSGLANLGAILGYDRSEYIDAACTGTGVSCAAKITTSLNRAQILAENPATGPSLPKYAKAMLAHLKANNIYDMADVIGGATLPPTTATALPSSLPYPVTTATPFVLDNTYRPTLRVQFSGIDQILSADVIYGKRLTLFFDGSGTPQLRLDGTAVGGAGTAIPIGTTGTITLTICHPYVSTTCENGSTWVNSGANQQFIQTLISGDSYVIASGWGPVSSNMVAYHHEALTKNRNAPGAAATDEPVMGEALATLSYTWIAQTNKVAEFILQIGRVDTFYHHQVGIAGHTGATGGPYVDLPGNVISHFPLARKSDGTRNSAKNQQAFVHALMHSSVLESSTIQQIMGTSAVSTAKLIDIGMSLANENQLYDFQSCNDYRSNAGNLTGYRISLIIQFENNVCTSGVDPIRTIAPRHGDLTDPPGSWTGAGWYGMASSGDGVTSFGAFINGGYMGGMASQVQPPAQSVQNADSSLKSAAQALKSYGQRAMNVLLDPVDAYLGNYLYDLTDLTTGTGGVPSELSFSRSYNSGAVLDKGGLGRGWTHNLDITARTGSDGFQALGQDSAWDAAEIITEMFISLDLLSDPSLPLTKIAVATVGNRWFGDRLSGNTAAITSGNLTELFVRLADGTYNPPPLSTGRLAKDGANNWIYTVATGSQIAFASPNTDNLSKAALWTDPTGLKVRFTYDGSGQLTSVVNSFGRGLTLSWTGGKITSVAEQVASGTARSVAFTYNGDDLQTVTDTRNKVMLFCYDAAGRMTRYYHPTAAAGTNCSAAGPFIINTYDSLGRVKQQIDAENHVGDLYLAGARSEVVTYAVYDAANPANNVPIRIVRYQNGLGQIIRSLDPRTGLATLTTYDGLGRPTRTIFPEGNAAEIAYDARSNAVQLCRIAKPPLGSQAPPCNDNAGSSDIITKIIYNEGSNVWLCANSNTCNQPSKYTDAEGIDTSFTYNSNGTPSTTTLARPSGASANPSISYGYTPFPIGSDVVSLRTSLTRRIDSATNTTVTNYSYDTANRYALKDITLDPAGLALTTTFTTDPVGNITGVDGPRTDVADLTTATYDGSRRPLRINDPNPGSGSPSTELTYDDDGRLVTVARKIGTNWLTSCATWTKSDQTKSIFGPWTTGAATRCNFASNTAVPRTDYDRDDADRLIGARVQLGTGERSTQLKLFADGRVWQVVQAAGTSLEQIASTNAYSDNGLPLSITDARGNTTGYAYDGFDRLAQLAYPNAVGGVSTTDRVSYAYDRRGFLMRRSLRGTSDASSSCTTCLKYGYDVLGRLRRKTAPAIGSAAPAYAVEYEYDLLGRPLSSGFGGSTTPELTWSYDKVSRLTAATADGRTLGYSYGTPAQGLAKTMTWWPAATGTLLTCTDALSRVVQLKEASGCSTSTGRLIAYTYDDLSRRLTATPSNGTSSTWTYKANGTLDTLMHNLAGSAADVQFGFDYNRAFQATSIKRDNDTYAWTNNYNIARPFVTNTLDQYTRVSAARPSYDSRGNLATDIINGVPWTYAYDAENRLVQASLGSGTVAKLSYDPAGRLKRSQAGGVDTRFQYDGDQLVAEYDASGTVLQRYVPGPGTDETALTYEGSAKNWYYADRLGSVIATAGSSGAVGVINAYGPFGEPGLAAANRNSGRLRYAGQMLLPEIGLYHYKARAYSPRWGRLLQTDPTGMADGTNLYAYVVNDPINGTDPSGTSASWTYTNTLGPGTLYDNLLARPFWGGVDRVASSPLGDPGLWMAVEQSSPAGVIPGALGYGGARIMRAVNGFRSARAVKDTDLAGTAIVNTFGATHANITVNYAGESFTTGLSNVRGLGTVFAESAEGATGSVVVALPNGSAAMNFARNSIGTGAPYNLSTNSCVTYCGQVLGAGGVQGVPGTTRGVINFLGLGR
ncbi:RHS repeat-associated core domain-containing protein [Methylobacterium sp. Leaf85]|uniref:RHS repeat-associated core domain-containing protein n=1 Tax=Methylobacterium sp. Leaf85 TaxID=1736241 RepID=UPI00138EEE8D|nr:RHS repeat-associated core domain-containing protein [Methylobacterium sp. Leaf85]